MSKPRYVISNKDIIQAQFYGSKDLGEIVQQCEKSIERMPVLADDGSSIVREFIGAYYALKNKFDEESLFDAHGAQTSRIVAAYFACNAVLNILHNDRIQQVHASDPDPYYNTGLISEDLASKSDRILMSTTLKKLQKRAENSDSKTIQYKAFTFFDHLKSLARIEIAREKNQKAQKIVTELKIEGESSNFNDIHKKKSSASSSSESGDNGKKLPIYVDTQPIEPPDYETDPKTQLKFVIGNKDSLSHVQTYVAEHAWFNSSAKTNRLGGKYPQNILLFGQAGVGKNYIIDAVFNWLKPILEAKNIEFEVKSMRDIGSIYKDGTLLRMKNQYTYLRQQKNKLLYVVFDEFNGLFPKGINGNSEEVKKVIAEFKVNNDDRCDGRIMTIALSNYVDESEIEPAIKSRFLPIYVPGPQTEDDYARLLWKESMIKIGSVEKDIPWMDLGKIVHTYAEQGFIVTGRDCANIIKSLYANTDSSNLDKIIQGIGASSEEQENLAREIFCPASQEMYKRAIQAYFKSQAIADQHRLGKKLKQEEI